jgi:hypothetical protein
VNDFLETGGVFLAALAIFLGLMRYVTQYMKNSEKRRAELFLRYEDTLTENVRLKAAMIVTADRYDVIVHERDAYRVGYTKYRKLYAKTQVPFPAPPRKTAIDNIPKPR